MTDIVDVLEKLLDDEDEWENGYIDGRTILKAINEIKDLRSKLERHAHVEREWKRIWG